MREDQRTEQQKHTEMLRATIALQQDHIERIELKWTTEPPTAPGWYWVNDPNSTRAKMGTDFKYVVRYEMFDIEEWLPKVADREIKWAGPITAPEEA